jgi:hypothetical protein
LFAALLFSPLLLLEQPASRPTESANVISSAAALDLVFIMRKNPPNL